ncbi:hypothetical protein [Acetobacter malorum]|uniref:hypothetical protein n=1 Tax=Acetobacter malorum TaxID=178901 RepID=UPI0039E7C9AA
MPVVEITLQEVRLTGTQSFTQTQAPQGSRTVCTGLVSAQSLQTSGSALATASGTSQTSTQDSTSLLTNVL